ncbi:hypothetical protein GQ600_8051 [Phytophthora cactorum]|nr:hypothetical protein GQ600_8051 [Phytophthora cactorum]
MLDYYDWYCRRITGVGELIALSPLTLLTFVSWRAGRAPHCSNGRWNVASGASFGRGEAPVLKDKRKKARKTQVKGKQTAYEARKEVKRDLVEKVKNLQKELGQLKFLLLVKQGEVDKATKRTETENGVLLEFIRKQHLVHAAMQAALTGHAVSGEKCITRLATYILTVSLLLCLAQQRRLNTLQPVQSVICLGTDQVERYNTLMTLKERQLANAERYLAARSRGLSPRSMYCQEECFDSAEGDYYVVRFETMFGCVAIREDNDFETSEFTQLRLVSATSAETIVESNSLLFSRFTSGDIDGEGSYGVMAADFVDFDALYPYRTNERVRRDGTTLAMVRSISSSDTKSPEVAVTRWTCLKIHQSLSRDAETEMKESSVCWGIPVKDLLSNSSFMGVQLSLPQVLNSSEQQTLQYNNPQDTHKRKQPIIAESFGRISELGIYCGGDDFLGSHMPVFPNRCWMHFFIVSPKETVLSSNSRTTSAERFMPLRRILEQDHRRIEVANSVLHEKTQHQHVTIAGMQSMLVSHMQSLSDLQPAQIVIRLGTDRAERRSTLMAMKDQKLREAKRFMTTWGQGLDTSSTFSQESQFEPLDGGSRYLSNRLVSSTKHGAVVESNSVIFSEYVEEPDGCYGIIAADFVDDDKLYPYRPEERIRRDTITAVLIRLASSDGKADQQDLVVVRDGPASD